MHLPRELGGGDEDAPDFSGKRFELGLFKLHQDALLIESVQACAVDADREIVGANAAVFSEHRLRVIEPDATVRANVVANEVTQNGTPELRFDLLPKPF